MSQATTQLDVRLRSLGEILDDAWQLCLLDLAPLQLVMTLFSVPWAAAVVWTLTQPRGAMPWLWPVATGLLLLLGGLGSGACQELLQQRASGLRPRVRVALWGCLRRGLSHLAVPAIVLPLLVLGTVASGRLVEAMAMPPIGAAVVGLFLLLIFALPGLLVWSSAMTTHALLAAGSRGVWEAYRAARREVRRQPGKALGLLLSRMLLLIIVAVNVHSLLTILLWLAENLAGFDVAFTRRLLELDSSVYLLSLALLSYLLLAPYFEVTHYLFHLDARTRYEGLDLWYRVQRQFPAVAEAQAVVAAGLALVVLLLPCSTGNLHAADLETQRSAVQHVRQQVQQARSGAYPGAERWAGRLQELATEADGRGAPAIVRTWFTDAGKGFRFRNEADARQILEQLESRLVLLEETLRPGKELPSKDHVKSLAGARSEARDSAPRAKPKPPPKKQEPPPMRQTRLDLEESPGSPSRSASAPSGYVFPWQLLAWVFVLAAGIAIVYAVIRMWKAAPAVPRPPTSSPQAPTLADELEKLLTAPPPPKFNRWQQADELAQQGRLLDAVRHLYLSVLVVLHQSNLIRFERMRTNGEYVYQLRSRRELQQPFRRLTSLFELKWYGQRRCAGEDYQSCRDLADQLAEGTQQHG